MKRLIVMFMALALALTPAAAAEAAKGGKAKNAAKACAVKKGKKGKKAKKARKACAKAKKQRKAAAVAPERAAAERECRADRRLDPEGFVADFGAGADAVAKCAAELLEATAGEEEPLEDEGVEEAPIEEGEDLPFTEEPEAPFDGADLPIDDDPLV
jgi:hypothetical protein